MESRYKFSIWCTKYESVTLVLFASAEAYENQTPSAEIPMEARNRGWFELELDSIPAGQLYMFKTPDGKLYPDPRSQSQPLGVHGPSAIVDTASFNWTDSNWTGVPLNEIILYELHPQAFNRIPQQSGESPFASIIDKLDYLKNLGITAIELMPVAESPGRSWGYDGVYPYAVTKQYGTAQQLQQLVNAAHKAGLAVVLDVVYNHFGPEGCYLGIWGDYYDSRFSNPWGQAINFSGENSDAVRQFVVENAAYWIRQFHLDGLRLDATDTIIDLSIRNILADIAHAVREQGKRQNRLTFTFAEDDDNSRIKILSESKNGYGLEGVWNIDFHHALHAVLTGQQSGLYADFNRSERFSCAVEALYKAFADGWVYDGFYRQRYKKSWGSSFDGLNPLQLVVYNQTHDQAGNAVESKRLCTVVSPQAANLAAAITLLSPYTPLLFMGEEYGEERPFPFFTWYDNPALVRAVRKGRQRDMEYMHQRKLPIVADPFAESTILSASLKWDSPCYQSRLQLYTDLIRLRKQTHIAGQSLKPYAQSNAVGLIYRNGKPSLLTWRWTDRTSTDVPPVKQKTYVAAANLTNDSVEIPVESDSVLLSTQWNQYGGNRNSFTDNLLYPWEFILFQADL